MTNEHSYTWKIFAKGIRSIAIVDLEVSSGAQGQNQIIENYSGRGFAGQGYIESVPKNGYDSWKMAARLGLEYAFSLINTNWTVTINKIEGRAYTDTNPTVVGYTVLRAFFEKIDFKLNDQQVERLEEFFLTSWRKPYVELIPDFSTLTFAEYP